MKTTQYVRQEKAIAAADSGGIRERWMWGLRLLRDPEAFSRGSSQLKPGRSDELIRAATSAGLRLSDREIRYRLQCARAYTTEAEIRHACAEFEDWSGLRSAGFPRFDVPADEPPADHRTDQERHHDRGRALLELVGAQGSLFPLDQFEPLTTSVKELLAYTEEMEQLTDRFRARDRNRRAYVESLVVAADNDLSMPWIDAHSRLESDTDESSEDAA